LLGDRKYMTDIKDSRTVTYDPRSFYPQILCAASLITGIIFTVTFFVTVPDVSVRNIPILLLLLTLLLIIAVAFFYFAGWFRMIFVFDRKARLLTRTRRGEETKVFDLTHTERIVSRTTFTNPGVRCSIIVQDSQGKSEAILEESPSYSKIRWATFSERLSQITELPLGQELWAEDMNGKLSPVPRERITANRKRNLLPILLALGCAFAGAAVFRIHPTPRFFLYVGMATVVLNTSVSLEYAILSKIKTGDSSTGYLVLIMSALTLVIPYSLFYLFFAFLLNGFRVPGQ
jgi:hypothetical protein